MLKVFVMIKIFNFILRVEDGFYIINQIGTSPKNDYAYNIIKSFVNLEMHFHVNINFLVFTKTLPSNFLIYYF